MDRTVRQSSLYALVAASVLAPLIGLPSASAVVVSAQRPSSNTVIRQAPPEICALLDIPEKRNLMDGLLFNLLWSCDREEELTGEVCRAGGPGPLRK